VGGAHAIAALAHGTQTIGWVDKIVGPGNAWVTAAKKDVYGTVGIDSLAGPTELVIVADASADPATMAVDLVAQAEHDPMARTTLVALDEDLPSAVVAALENEIAASPRREIVEAAMEFTVIYAAEDEEEAAAISDHIAPEHLQIVTGHPQGFLAKARRYGAAFLGPLTPVSFGDYGVGSNHVLPTMANARFSSGLRAADFVTVSSWIEVQEGANDIVGPGVERIASAEGLAAHAKASRIRRRAD
jgi:histidinol dehydrogenase